LTSEQAKEKEARELEEMRRLRQEKLTLFQFEEKLR
jgi:hypothetical protein